MTKITLQNSTDLLNVLDWSEEVDSLENAAELIHDQADFLDPLIDDILNFEPESYVSGTQLDIALFIDDSFAVRLSLDFATHLFTFTDLDTLEPLDNLSQLDTQAVLTYFCSL